MEFPGDPASLSNSTIPAPSLALLRRETVAWFTRRETVAWFTFSLGDLEEGCFVSHKTQCSALMTSASHHSLSASPLRQSATAGFESTTTDRTTSYRWYFVTLSWSFFPVLSPQCRGFLLDGQRQSSKLSLIADRHDKSQIVRSIAAVRQRKVATKLAIFFRFFRAFLGTFQWQTACKSNLRVFSWGLHSAKFRKTALGSKDLSTLPLKTEVEIFRGCTRPSCPSRVTPLACICWYW